MPTRRQSPPKPEQKRRSTLYLRAHRQARGLSQTELAAAIGKTKGLLSQIETGRAQASLQTLEDITAYFGLAHLGMLFEPPVPAGWRRITAIVPNNAKH